MVALCILEAAPQLPAGSSALVWLGIALVALAASAAAVFWWLRAGATRVGAAERAAMGALPMTCPACRRGYPAGHDLSARSTPASWWRRPRARAPSARRRAASVRAAGASMTPARASAPSMPRSWCRCRCGRPRTRARAACTSTRRTRRRPAPARRARRGAGALPRRRQDLPGVRRQVRPRSDLLRSRRLGAGHWGCLIPTTSVIQLLRLAASSLRCSTDL